MVAFADEMEDESKSQGWGSQVLGFELPDHGVKDQLEVKSKTISSSSASELDGCLKVHLVPGTLGGFDDTITIYFNPSIFQSPEVQSLSFLDKSKTPQSCLVMPGPSTEGTEPANQGKGPELQNI